MVRSFSNSATRQFVETGKAKFSGMDVEKAKMRLNMLNSATSLDDMVPLKSIGLHKLGGGRRGQWAMTINGPWRLCFRFADGDAHDVEIVDYH